MTPQPAMLVAAAAALTAAAIHTYLFTRESIFFTRPTTLHMLEIDPQHAQATRLWAYHQGIYNLLLGAIAATGAVTLLTGPPPIGATLLWASSSMMTIAALALLLADRRPQRIPGFLAQAAPALICLIALIS